MVLNLFHKAVSSKYINDHIQERNSTNVINVLKPYYNTVVFKFIKEHVLERNPLNVSNMVMPLHKCHLLTHKRIHNGGWRDGSVVKSRLLFQRS